MKHPIGQVIGKSLPLNVPNIFKAISNKLNFEFMDLNGVPASLRATLRDILEVGNGAPFRSYYDWTAAAVFSYAKKNNLKEVVELGAGCAPITKHLIKNYPAWDVSFLVTDLNPDTINFGKLEKSDKRVTANYQPMDFTKKMKGYENSLLVLSATFHHVPENQKRSILNNLKNLSPHVMVIEPLRPNLLSLLFVIGALVSGFLTPIFKLNSKSFFRCFFWCWVLPIAPLFFLWDGWISALRCWNEKKWQSQEPKAVIEQSLFCTKIILTK